MSAGKTILKGQTDHDGIVKFSDIPPQKYFLTAMKKEYSFGSGAVPIEVLEEEHKVLKLAGERVAFSAYGQVTTLSG